LWYHLKIDSCHIDERAIRIVGVVKLQRVQFGGMFERGPKVENRSNVIFCNFLLAAKMLNAHWALVKKRGQKKCEQKSLGQKGQKGQGHGKA
jgi:hypothetical protein